MPTVGRRIVLNYREFLPSSRIVLVADLIVLERLIEAFGAARVASASGDTEALRHAVRLGRTSASELYMSLDPTGSPELSAHLHGVLDLCMERLEHVARHTSDGVDVPLGLLAAIRPSLEVGEKAPPQSGFRLSSAAPVRSDSIAARRTG